MYKQHDFVITLSANLRSSVIQRIKKKLQFWIKHKLQRLPTYASGVTGVIIHI